MRQSTPAVATAQPRRVLIYNFTCGTYHDEAIVRATRALELMCEKTGAFTTTAGFAAAIFMPEKLRDKFGLKDIKQGGPLPELLA